MLLIPSFATLATLLFGRIDEIYLYFPVSFIFLIHHLLS